MKKSELIKLIREVIKENLEQGYTLDELTFDIVRQFFPKGDITFPNADDSSRNVFDERDLEEWKAMTRSRFGNVRISFDPNAVWYDQVKIEDEKFNRDKEAYIQNKAAAMDKWGTN